MDAKSYVDQLNAFADAESVKEFLKMMGATGYRQDEMSCPISSWIGRAIGHPVITEDTISVCTGPDWNYDVEEYSISPAVREFIMNFDLGHYPELDVEDGWY